MLRDIEDWRIVAFLMDDMDKGKPSDLAEMLKSREAKLAKKYSFAQKNREYNQPTITPKKTMKKSHSPDR